MKQISIYIRKFLFALIILANPSLLFAQNSDWRLWTSIDAEKKLSENWDLTIGAQYRWMDIISVTDQIRGSTDVFWTLGKYIQLGAGYELIARKNAQEDIFVYRNRFRVQSRVQYRYAQFTVDWRFRTQLTMIEKEDFSGGITFDNQYHRWALRNRFRLRYNIRNTPLRPYLSFELFHQPLSVLEYRYIQNRFTIGSVFNINQSHNIEVDYRLETEIVDANKFRYNIVKIGYVFSF